jgi:hypothetical protein
MPKFSEMAKRKDVKEFYEYVASIYDAKDINRMMEEI